ncbi:hypothetical protein EV368DRAFT_70055 [Lentinula lateritia]|nr:hypothetical protein EV368DRAFT_70055 [Lentinula lateritia]
MYCKVDYIDYLYIMLKGKVSYVERERKYVNATNVNANLSERRTHRRNAKLYRPLLFCAEIKPLDYKDWFTPEAYDVARVQIVSTVNQVNTQAQYICEEFQIDHTRAFTIYAFIIAVPYWVLVDYTNNSLSPDFFTTAHSRRNGPYTRFQVPVPVAEDADMEIDIGVEVPAEEEDAEDVVTTSGFPYGTEPRCLFKMRRLGDDDRDDDSEGDELGEDNDDLDDLNEDEGDEEEEAKSEGGMFNGEFSLDLPLRRHLDGTISILFY